MIELSSMKLGKAQIKDDIKTVIKYGLAVFISLFYFELLLHYIVNSNLYSFNIYNILFLIPISIVITSLLGFHSKINNLVMILLLFVISLFYIANLIYFETFKSLASISMIGNGTNAITNFWWSTITTIKENTVDIVLFELPIILLIIEAIFVKKLNNKYSLLCHPITLVMGIIMWLVVVASLSLGGTEDYTAYGAYHSRFVDTDTASKKLGVLPNALVETRYILFGSSRENLIEIEEVEEKQEVLESTIYNVYDDLDFVSLANNSDNNQIKNVCDYLNTVEPTKKNKHTGEFEGYNLIYICGESFSSMAIDKDITPTLYKLSTNGYILDNYYNSFKNVTTNGEYAMLTGLWPDIAREETNNGRLTGTMGQSVDNDMSESLGKKFNSIGVNSRAFHNYWGSYYGREETLPNMGFECMFMGKGMWFTTDWPASDLEMMIQSVDTYINDDQFCAYYMTFSGHGNYSMDNFMVQKNMEYVLEKAQGKNYPENLLGYFACNVELDKALEYLIDRLTIAGKLENTVIVLAGDHYPYYVTDYDYECFNGKRIRNDYEKYHSTCILYNAGMKEAVHVEEPCCNVDILPTILNLFNIKYDSRLYAGSDIFSNSRHVAMIYDKSFITENFIYNATNGEVTWIKNQGTIPKDKQASYINKFVTYVKGKYAFSISVENTDFYSYIKETKQ